MRTRLEVALNYLTSPAGGGLTPTEALAQIEDAVLDASPTSVDRIVIGLFDCFEEALLPLLFPDCPACLDNALTDEELDTFLAAILRVNPALGQTS